jgi:hypothetical protein
VVRKATLRSVRVGCGCRTPRPAPRLSTWVSRVLDKIEPQRQVKDLAALPFLRLCLEPASGSTVEARGSVIVGKSRGWRVGR